MNPLAPVNNLVRMVTTPVKAVFVVGLCWVINAMTFHGVWWVKWVALGMGIATLVAIGRGLKTVVLLGLAFWIGRWLMRRYGPQAQALFDQWVDRERPNASQMLQSTLRVVRSASAGAASTP